MQCDDLDVEIQRPVLNELDTGLNELGMLATRTKSREEYLQEIHNKRFLSMLSLKTRYVSNMSFGFKVRPATPHVRYKPYSALKQRHRTKSENGDSGPTEAASFIKSVIDDCIDSAEEMNQLKKAKSLESIISEGQSQIDLGSIKVGNDVETVSTCIKNLRVDE
ncbi:uncharacterized protein LOC109608901 [Aethina tumida]|uniref:uncharacterized protein LOC109608901 n=1 Tax=Aethina tumida TaxID=116153 RepID=UPI00096AF4E9|nr:uncharacterized protein LOC109608901 [Aethina tumida]